MPQRIRQGKKEKEKEKEKRVRRQARPSKIFFSRRNDKFLPTGTDGVDPKVGITLLYLLCSMYGGSTM